jgi:hypothetical protein
MSRVAAVVATIVVSELVWNEVIPEVPGELEVPDQLSAVTPPPIAVIELKHVVVPDPFVLSGLLIQVLGAAPLTLYVIEKLACASGVNAKNAMPRRPAMFFIQFFCLLAVGNLVWFRPHPAIRMPSHKTFVIRILHLETPPGIPKHLDRSQRFCTLGDRKLNSPI